MRVLTMLLSLLLSSQILYSQMEDGEFYYGFKAGVIYSGIDDISTTIIPSFFPENTYTTSLANRLGFAGSFFIHHRFENSKLAIQPELSYSQGGGDFLYSDVEGLDYTIAFKYSYFDIAPILKINLAGGFHFDVGPRISFALEENNLTYVSNQPELGPDLQIQQSLREVLKARNNFNILLGVGYDLPMGLMVNFEYHLGLSDVIETQANGFYFIENKNSSSSYQFSVAYAIPFYGR